jgi:glycosyltransferase involved in cell wall biosynthesis
MKATKTPKVSVCVVTYNQEEYIRQCLQSLVDQEADFDFEIIVGEDCSTDGTRKIVQEFAERYPGLVKPIFHENNVGGTKNYFAVHMSATGEYVAHVDGDDCALPGKLKSQVSILDKSPNLSACCHSLRCRTKELELTKKYWGTGQKTINLHALLKHHPLFGHSSLMYRRSFLSEYFSNKNHDAAILDFTIYVELAKRGSIYLDSGIYGLYTVGVGISSQENFTSILEKTILGLYGTVGRNIVNQGLARLYFHTAKIYIVRNDDTMFKTFIGKSVSNAIISPAQMMLFFCRNQPKILRMANSLKRRIIKW